jgi:hypothetical protein
MVALFVTVDIIELSRLKLNMNEYFSLMKLQHDSEGKSFPFVVDERFIPRLIDESFVVREEDGTYSLGPEGIKVFKNENDRFEEFYALFPHKVPTGMGFRPVSTLDVGSTSAKVTRTIWDRIIKNKPYLQETIISNLKKELAQRQSDGSLSYLHNIDTWLRQATWEKWEDIPDAKSSTRYTKLL